MGNEKKSDDYMSGRSAGIEIGHKECLLIIRRLTEFSKNRGLTMEGVRYIAIGYRQDQLGEPPVCTFNNITNIDLKIIKQ